MQRGRQWIRRGTGLSFGMLAVISACRDQAPVAPVHEPEVPRSIEAVPVVGPVMSSTLGSITQIDPFTYPRYPERWSVGLDAGNGSEGARGSFTSVIFTQPERVYLDTALVQARVTGIRQRFYAQIPAWNSRPVPIGGQPWMPQDAAGDWINSSGCQGNIQLEGMVGGAAVWRGGLLLHPQSPARRAAPGNARHDRGDLGADAHSRAWRLRAQHSPVLRVEQLSAVLRLHGRPVDDGGPDRARAGDHGRAEHGVRGG
jgi:hypothetical protein